MPHPARNAIVTNIELRLIEPPLHRYWAQAFDMDSASLSRAAPMLVCSNSCAASKVLRSASVAECETIRIVMAVLPSCSENVNVLESCGGQFGLAGCRTMLPS